MNIIKNIAASLAIAVTFIASASASVIQTGTGSGSYNGYEAWGLYDLSTVSFAKGTNVVTNLSSSAVAYDQGWGYESPNENRVLITLYQGTDLLWAAQVAGASHGSFNTQYFDIANNPAGLDSLNKILGGLAWNDNQSVTMRLQANPLGYGGWELHVRNANFTVTSDVPEPASLALLGLGLAGLAAGRRKSKRA